MQFSEFIDRHGIVFGHMPTKQPAIPEGVSLDILISRKGGEMVTEINLSEGREFSPVALLSVMQHSFRMLEAEGADAVAAKFGANGRNTVDKLAHTKDEFRRVLGETLFRRFMDEVGAPQG